MPFGTFSELQTKIIETAMRQSDAEFIASTSDFIRLCEVRLADEIELSDQQDAATVTITGGVGSLPSGFVYAERVIDDRDGHELTQTDRAQASDRYANDGSGYAQEYAIVGNTIEIYPPATTTLTLDYYATFTPLSDADPTNWLLTKAPHLYLYGSLLEAMPYMEDDGRMATWGNLFEKALGRMKRRDKLKRFGRARVNVQYKTP